MRRRKYPSQPAEPRKDWRDPNMTVSRDYIIQGSLFKEVSPEFEQNFRARSLSMNSKPTWRDDPTYNLGKPARRNRR